MSLYGNKLEAASAPALRGVPKIAHTPAIQHSMPPVLIQLDGGKPTETELTLAEIIKDKPRTKVVRQFMKAQLAAIKSQEEELFENF